MKVLITGAAGSVGRHLVRHCLENGWSIRAYDASPAVGSLGDGLPAGRAGLLDTVCARVEDVESLGEAVAGVDAVVHLAWSFSEDPKTLLATDINGHIELLECMAWHSRGRGSGTLQRLRWKRCGRPSWRPSAV